MIDQEANIMKSVASKEMPKDVINVAMTVVNQYSDFNDIAACIKKEMERQY